MRLFTIYVASFYFACSRGNYLTLLSATALIANTSYMLPNFIVLLSYCIDIIVFLQQRQLFDTSLWCTWGGCCPHCQPFTYCLILLLYCYLIALILLYFCSRGKNSKPLSTAVERLLPSMPTLYVAQFYCYCYWYCCISALLSSTEVKLCSPLQLRGCCPHCQHFTYICCLILYCDFY